MGKKHFSVASRAIEPSGRGPVTLRVVEVAAEHAVVEMGVDYAKADVPERAYYADYCDVQRARVGYSLFFGKLIPGTSRLRTKIEVAFPEDMFLQQLWRSSRDFHRTIKGIAEKAKLQPIEISEDTDKVQTFRSNNVFMGAFGEEALLDFYYISPKDMYLHGIKHTGEVTLEPVVRVVVGTLLIYEFLEKCGAFVEGPAAVVASPPGVG